MMADNKHKASFKKVVKKVLRYMIRNIGKGTTIIKKIKMTTNYNQNEEFALLPLYVK